MNSMRKPSKFVFCFLLLAFMVTNIMAMEPAVEGQDRTALSEDQIGWSESVSRNASTWVRYYLYSDNDTYTTIPNYKNLPQVTPDELKTKIAYAIELAANLNKHLSDQEFTNYYYLTYKQRIILATVYNDFTNIMSAIIKQLAPPRDAAESAEAKDAREKQLETTQNTRTIFISHPFWRRELITDLAYTEAKKTGIYPIEDILNGGFSAYMSKSYEQGWIAKTTDSIKSGLIWIAKKVHIFSEEPLEQQQPKALAAISRASDDALLFVKTANAAHQANPDAPYNEALLQAIIQRIASTKEIATNWPQLIAEKQSALDRAEEEWGNVRSWFSGRISPYTQEELNLKQAVTNAKSELAAIKTVPEYAHQAAIDAFKIFDQARRATSCATNVYGEAAAGPEMPAPSIVDARVENAQDLSNLEVDYCTKRNVTIGGTKPIIALCFSGGGYRAMISSAGFLAAAKEIGLLDASTYISTLSGSTWLISALLAHNNHSTSPTLKGILERKDDLSPFLAHLKAATSIDLKTHYSDAEIAAIRQVFEEKKRLGQRIQMIDLWGALISQRLLGTQDMYLSQCKTEPAQFPYPIFTAVVNDTVTPEDHSRRWLTITPDYVENNFLDARIPLKAFGNWFMHGHQISPYPEQRLGFYVGTFGSAFAADLLKILEEAAPDYVKKTLRVGKALLDVSTAVSKAVAPEREFTKGLEKAETITEKAKATLETTSLLAALQPNFAYNPDSAKPLPRISPLETVDAGLAINLPLPPLLAQKRHIDIIFVCDVSDDTCKDGTKGTYKQIRATAEYAAANRLPFPNIDRPISINDGKLLIFRGNPDEHIPTIAYFPNMVPFDTFKLQYSPDEFDRLCGYMKEAVLTNRQTIWDEIASLSRPSSPSGEISPRGPSPAVA